MNFKVLQPQQHCMLSSHNNLLGYYINQWHTQRQKCLKKHWPTGKGELISFFFKKNVKSIMHNWSIQNSCNDFCQLCTKTNPEFLNMTIWILSVHSHCLLNKPSSLWIKLLVAMSFVSLIHGRQNIINKYFYFTYQNTGLTIQNEEESFIRLTFSQTHLILSSGDCLPTLICFAHYRQVINIFVYHCPSIILHSYSTKNQQWPYEHFKVIFQKESWHCKSRQWILRTIIGITNQYESLETTEEKPTHASNGM